MTAVSIMVLPPARTWGAEAEQLAQGLVDAVEAELEGVDRRRHLAGISLLVRIDSRVWSSPEFRPYVFRRHPRNGTSSPWLLWNRLGLDVDARAFDLGPAERAIVLIAASIATNQPVHLGALLCDIAGDPWSTYERLEDVAEAFAYVAEVNR